MKQFGIKFLFWWMVVVLAVTMSHRYADSSIIQEPTGVKLFYSTYDGTLKTYKEMSSAPCWTTRWGANWLVKIFMPPPITDVYGRIIAKIPDNTTYKDVLSVYHKRVLILKSDMERGVFLWTLLWLLATFSLLWFFPYPLTSLTLFFAALQLAFIQHFGNLVFPWDVPILFFFTLAVLAVYKQNIWLLFASVIIGLPFKETILVMTIPVLFFTGLSKIRRLISFIIFFGVAFSFKTSYDFIMELDRVGNTILIFPHWKDNLQFLITPSLYHPILLNAGLIIPFLIISILKKEWKYLFPSLVFIGGQFIGGNFAEIRIFHELIPMSIMVLLSDSEIKK